VTICGSLHQCVPLCGSVQQRAAVWCRVVQCGAVCCSVLQCVAVAPCHMTSFKSRKDGPFWNHANSVMNLNPTQTHANTHTHTHTHTHIYTHIHTHACHVGGRRRKGRVARARATRPFLRRPPT